MVERISPKESHDLMENDGYTYVDVRSVPEFEAGHPAGAVNIPWAFANPAGGMTPNPDFLDVMKKMFTTDAKIVFG